MVNCATQTAFAATTPCSNPTFMEEQKRLDSYDDIAKDSIIYLGGTVDSRSFGKEFLYAQIKDEAALASIPALAQFEAQSDANNLKYLDEVKRGLKYPLDSLQLIDLYNKLGFITPVTQPEIRYKEVFELALNNPPLVRICNADALNVDLQSTIKNTE